ncbi:MAG: hypothetical protein R3F61_33855 [Myxococcota bacterium]
MRRISWGAGIVSVGFVLACMGGEAPKPSPKPPPAPAAAPAPAPEAPKDGEAGENPDGEPGEATEAGGAEGEGTTEGAEGTDAATDGEFWCCEYDGPLGKTHALIDSPAECTEQFGSNGAEFVKGPQCEPECCKYAQDPADLGKGYLHEVVAKANCDMRKGERVEPSKDVCPSLLPEGTSEASPKPRPRPAPRGPLTRPGTQPAPAPGGQRGGSRPTPKPGGLTRPGG